MKTIRIALIVLALLALLSQAALCQQVWQEQKITSGPAQWRGSPQVWNQSVYYGEIASNWISDVYVWTQAEGSRRLIGGDGVSRAPVAVWENNIVISYIDNHEHKLYLRDSSGVDTPVATGTGDMVNASMYGQTVVYENRQAGVPSQVWIFDPVNGGRPLHPTSSRQTNPRIWGDQVVYEDDRAGRTDVYLWNPRDGERKLSTYFSGMQAPAIYRDRVTMWLIGGSFAEDRGLWEWTPEHDLRQLAQRNYTFPYVKYPRMWGDLVTYAFWNGNTIDTVGAWDPTHGFTWVSESAGSFGNVSGPSVYGNTIAWAGDNNVYLSTLVPEPAGLTAVSISLCLMWPALGLCRRRR